MKLNPEYKKWKEAQNASNGIAAPATTVINSDQALPVVSSMEGTKLKIANVDDDDNETS
jgi:hypothetical protein